MSEVIYKSYAKERTEVLTNKLKNGLLSAGVIFKNQAKENVSTPKPSGKIPGTPEHWWRDTNELANSIGAENANGVWRLTQNGNELSLDVGTKVKYAIPLELSARGHYPFMFPALELKRNEMKDAIKNGGGKMTGVDIYGGIWEK